MKPDRLPRRRARLAAVGILLALAPIAWRVRPKVVREARLLLAGRDVAAGRLDRAEIRLDALIAERPSDARPRLLLVEVARRLGRITEAEEILQRAVEIGLPIDRARRESALLMAGQDFRRAETSLREVIGSNPADIEARRALAEGYARAGRPADAEAAVSGWLGREPESVEALLIRAKARGELGSFGEAEADLRAILGRDPSNFVARLLLADCRLDGGEIAEAGAEYDACRKSRPDRPEPLVGLALCASRRGDPGESETLLDRALALAPFFEPALAARGRAFLARGDGEKAIPFFERVAALGPRNRDNLRTLADLRRKAGDETRAGEIERALRDLGPAPTRAPRRAR